MAGMSLRKLHAARTLAQRSRGLFPGALGASFGVLIGGILLF